MVKSLPSRKRDILILTAKGLPREAIAKKFGISLSSVGLILRRARGMLEEILKDV